MKATEAAALLTIAAAYDNRKPDPDAAKAWAMALEDLRFEDCRQVVVQHYRQSRQWLMPVDVIEGVAAVRVERLRNYPHLITPPPELGDDPMAENAWVRAIKTRIADGEHVPMDEANGSRGALEDRKVAALGQAGREVPRA